MKQALKISKSQFATALGISRQRVNAMIGEGLPVDAGQIDLEKGLAWVRANVQPRHESAIGGDSLVRARIAKLEVEVAIRRLELAEKEGELLRADEAEAAWSKMITDARSRLLSIPGKLSTRVAAESDPIVCEELIQDEIYRALDELAYPDDSPEAA